MLAAAALRISSVKATASAASTRTPSLSKMFHTNVRLTSTPPSLPLPPFLGGYRTDVAQSIPVGRKYFIGCGSRSFSSKSKATNDDLTPAPIKRGNEQHETWVEFQKSISVSGFETGQTTIVSTRKKGRGGKLDRKKREREAELEAAMKGHVVDVTQLKGGEFPSLRYSDEETARLLAEAYANIPVRTGPRGTNNLRRQKRRWWIKRQYDARKKWERKEEHTARMKRRHAISEMIFKVKTGAGEVKERDADYQRGILEKWAEMSGYSNGGTEKGGLMEHKE